MKHAGLIAGPNLFAPCTSEAVAWWEATVAWERLVRRLHLRIVSTPNLWEELRRADCAPSYARIAQPFAQANLSGVIGAAMTTIAALQSAVEYVEWEGVVTDWSSSGCLSAVVARGIAEEIVIAALIVSPTTRTVVGSAARDEEDLRVEGIEGDGTSDLDTGFDVSCHTTPDAYLATLDPGDFWEEPQLAIEMASARLLAVGTTDPSRFQVLPQLAPSLAAMDHATRRGAFEAMAQSLLPRDQRPRGLEEHEVREGAGPNEPAVRSRRGVLLRIDLTKHGIGWRLHLWRGQDGVTFTHVSPKTAPIVIYE